MKQCLAGATEYLCRRHRRCFPDPSSAVVFRVDSPFSALLEVTFPNVKQILQAFSGLGGGIG